MTADLFLSFLVISLALFFSGPSWSAPSPDENTIESLISLPYTQYVKTEKAPDKVGTTIYKKDKVYAGYNIYTSNMEPDGFVNLIDMDGTLIHKWARRDPESVSVMWEQVTPFPDGTIFLTCIDKGANRARLINWQWVDVNSYSFTIYSTPLRVLAHHSAYWLKEGGFLGIINHVIYVPFQGLTLKANDNALVHVAADGRGIKTIPLSKLFAGDPYYERNFKRACGELRKYLAGGRDPKAEDLIFDLTHPNNIENLEWDIPGIAEKGDWLVTSRYLDRIFIVDPEQEKVIWQWGEGSIEGPHQATFLKEGQILLLDNGVHKKSSRVIVLDMRSKKVIWQYGQKPGQEFFTAEQGSVQRLPNGNTLINERDKGRVFEVTLSGEIVWEWYNDFFTKGSNKGKRRPPYRMQRLSYDFFKGVKFNYGKVDPEVKNRKKE